MHPRELQEFRDNVAVPHQLKLFENTTIPENACYINQVDISFYDGRSWGVESQINASGLIYRNGIVEEYHFSETDISPADFFAQHKDCVFLSDCSLRIMDELEEMDLSTVIRNLSTCTGIFHQLGNISEIKTSFVSIEYEKMKFLHNAQTTGDASIKQKPPLAAKVKNAAIRAGEFTSPPDPPDKCSMR